MTATRVILVSDSHLSPDAPEAQHNWAAVVRYVATAGPDLVIHLGDLSLDGMRNPADLDHARRQLELLPAPWRVIPGNHDVGDNPLPGEPAGLAIDDTRQQRWLDAIGPDHWSLTLPGWTLLALNAQLAGSGLAAEASQWAWLEEQVSQAGHEQRIALISHKPLAAPEPELAVAPSYRFWPAAARDRLARLFAGRPPALVVSGHVHQSRLLRHDGTEHLWVPTTWAMLPDSAQRAIGSKRAGLVALELTPGADPLPEFVEPDGLAQLTITADVPDPYRRR